MEIRKVLSASMPNLLTRVIIACRAPAVKAGDVVDVGYIGGPRSCENKQVRNKTEYSRRRTKVVFNRSFKWITHCSSIVTKGILYIVLLVIVHHSIVHLFVVHHGIAQLL